MAQKMKPPKLETGLTRNNAEMFAERTVKNLEVMLRVHQGLSVRGAKVHPVTHLTNSLFGTVIFLCARMSYVSTDAQQAPLGVIWAEWAKGMPGASAEPTFREFIEQVRHALSHGNVKFETDDSDPEAEFLKFENRVMKRTVWEARIRADHLIEVCRNISILLRDGPGAPAFADVS